MVRALVLCLLAFCCAGRADEVLKVRLTNGEWPPFMSRSLPHYGVATRIVTQAFKAGGVDVEYGFFPWKRAYKLAEDGVWHGSVGWTYTESRVPKFFFSEPLLISQESFFHLKGIEFDWHTMDDLTGLRIGAGAGYFYGEPFRQAEAEGRIQVQRVTTDLQSFKRLLVGHVDLVIINLYVGQYLLQEFPTKQAQRITHHPRAVRKANWHLILSKKVAQNPLVLKRFNLGLARIKAEGKPELWLRDLQR